MSPCEEARELIRKFLTSNLDAAAVDTPEFDVRLYQALYHESGKERYRGTFAVHKIDGVIVLARVDVNQ